MEKYRASASDWFDRGERDARQKGSKQRVDKIKVDRQVFEEHDELPDTAPAALKRTFQTAQADMESAYRRAVAEYTKVKKDDEAPEIEQELARFKKNEILNPLDRLQAGTVWSGNSILVIEGKPGRSEPRMSLTILERDGDRFTERLESETVIRIINGHIKGRRLWWTKEDVIRVEKGTDRGLDNFGYLNDKQIRIRHAGKTESGVEIYGVVEFRLVETK